MSSSPTQLTYVEIRLRKTEAPVSTRRHKRPRVLEEANLIVPTDSETADQLMLQLRQSLAYWIAAVKEDPGASPPSESPHE
jgi:hypothetical protein